MPAWTSPINWANGPVTAATMNAEVRDHLEHLKGALDLITNGTSADSGSLTYLSIARSTSGLVAFQARIAGDTHQRIRVLSSGRIEFGTGSVNEGGDDGLYIERGFEPDGSLPAILIRSDQTDVAAPNVWAYSNSGSSPMLGVAQASRRAWMQVREDQHPSIWFQRSDGIAWIESDAAYRIVARAASGSQARFGVILDNAGAETNAIFAWVDGDTQPRVSIGIRAGGVGRIIFGAGGSVAPDAELYRSAANQLRTDDGFVAGGNFVHLGTQVAFFGHSTSTQPTVTGSRGGNAALASLLTALDNMGLVIDNSS